MSNPIVQMLNSHLANFGVTVQFLDPVIEDDLPRYDHGQVRDILAAILKRFEGNGHPHQVVEKWKLKGDLFGYFKIRLKSQMIRIVYRTDESDKETLATIVVIGPRKAEEAYKIAKKRIAAFF